MDVRGIWEYWNRNEWSNSTAVHHILVGVGIRKYVVRMTHPCAQFRWHSGFFKQDIYLHIWGGVGMSAAVVKRPSRGTAGGGFTLVHGYSNVWGWLSMYNMKNELLRHLSLHWLAIYYRCEMCPRNTRLLFIVFFNGCTLFWWMLRVYVCCISHQERDHDPAIPKLALLFFNINIVGTSLINCNGMAVLCVTVALGIPAWCGTALGVYEWVKQPKRTGYSRRNVPPKRWLDEGGMIQTTCQTELAPTYNNLGRDSTAGYQYF